MSSAQAATGSTQRVVGVERFRSVDLFRGANIAAMILVNSEFAPAQSYSELVHAAWNGWTFADTIFPCFLFIVGVSLVFSTSSRLARGGQRTDVLGHVLRRSALIFIVGLVIDYLRFPTHEFPFVGLLAHIQLSGVLQKIAICYLVASLIYVCVGLRGVIGGIVFFNLLYLYLLYFYPVPGCGPGSLVLSCNFPGYLDAKLLDGFRSDSVPFDGDGVGAILPAVTSVLFGALAGRFLLQHSIRRTRILSLLSGGLALIIVGELLATQIPINKLLWTPSFAILMAGLASVGLAVLIWLIDGRPQLSSSRPLEILGRNAIAAYVLSRFLVNVPKVHVAGKSLYADGLARLATPPNASLLFAMVVLAAVFSVIWLMDRRGWHLKF
jgi:predicted acyltransferase